MRESPFMQALACTVAVLAVAAPHAAFADDNAAADASKPRGEGQAELEAIVVSAQRRTENLQSVPVAVTAVSGEALSRQGIHDVQALTQAVPGLNYDRSSQGATPYIRGVGVNSSVMGNEPSVATFIDDVYVPYNVAGYDFNGVSRIEVARGPQGTLFGRNATGGVIQIFTRDPDDKPQLDASVGYGNFETVRGQLYGSVPLGPTLAVNLALSGIHQGEGWGRNVLRGTDAYRTEGYGVRAKLKWTPTDRTTVLLAFNRDVQKSDLGLANRVVAGTAGYGNVAPETAYPGIGFYDQATDLETWWRNRSDRYSAKVEHEFAPFTLTSVTAYNDVDTYISSDVDAGPVARFGLDLPNTNRTFTQELRLTSNAAGPLKWIVGGFYMHDKAVYDAVYLGSAFTALGGTGVASVYADQVTHSYSGFGQASYEFAGGTTLTAGARYTSDQRRFFGQAIWNFTGGTTQVAGPFRDRKTFNKLTFRVSLDQRVSEDAKVYAGFSRGFKSGVYNLAAISPSPLPTSSFAPPVQPEVLDAYTAGFKSEWLDRRLRINGEAFYYDYRNIQVTTLQTGGTLLLNGAAARVKGVEFEVQAIPVPGLTITASGTYMHARFKDFADGPTFFPVWTGATPIAIPAGCGNIAYPTQSGANPLQQRACSLSGNRMGHAPDFTSTIAVNYTTATPYGEISFNVGYTHTSPYYFEPDNLYATRQKTTDLLNASLGWQINDHIGVRIHGKNLTARKYYSYVAESTTSGVKYSPAEPRTYGITMSYKM